MFPNQNEPVKSPGDLLQAAREEKNLRPEDVAYEIRLTPSQVLALEENDYSSMPEETYVRGYLRNYARLVDVPENDVLMAFARLTRSSEKVSQPVIPVSESDATISGKGVRWLAAGIIVAVILLSAVWVLEPFDRIQSGAEKTEIEVKEEKAVVSEVPVGASTLNLDKPVEKPVKNNEVLASKEAAQPETESKPAIDPWIQPGSVAQQNAGSTTASSEAASQTQAQGYVPSAQPSTTAAESESRQQAVSDGTLFISYSKDSWTDIRDANGKKLLYRTVKKGEKIALAGELPMSLFFGFAQGVKVSFNGKDIDVESHTRGVFARFSVGEAPNQ